MVSAFNAMYISCCKISLPVPYLGGYDPCVGGLYMSCHSLLQTLLLHHSKMLSWRVLVKFFSCNSSCGPYSGRTYQNKCDFCILAHSYLCRYCRMGSLLASSSPPSTVDRPSPRQGLLMHDFFKASRLKPARYNQCIALNHLFNIQSKCMGFSWLVEGIWLVLFLPSSS